jgi:hypothetical protein
MDVRIITSLMAALLAASVSVCLAIATETIPAGAIADALGFNFETHAQQQAGEILWSEIEETAEKQPAVVLAPEVPATIGAIAESMANGAVAEANTHRGVAPSRCRWTTAS